MSVGTRCWTVVLMGCLAPTFSGAQEPHDAIARWSVSTVDPAPADCAAQIDAVREALVDLDVPVSRRFNRTVSREFAWVVVCDESAWFHLKSQLRYAHLQTVSGMTDFPNHVVFLNGFRRSPASLRDTVAHEMGHMLCHCVEEERADDWRLALLRQARQMPARPGNEVAAAPSRSGP